jgi:hypothetical protein
MNFVGFKYFSGIWNFTVNLFVPRLDLVLPLTYGFRARSTATKALTSQHVELAWLDAGARRRRRFRPSSGSWRGALESVN